GQHRGFFHKNKKHAFARAGCMHQRGKHSLRSLGEVPLCRQLGAEIGEGFNRAQQATKVFFRRCHPTREQQLPEQFESTTHRSTCIHASCWLVWCERGAQQSRFAPDFWIYVSFTVLPDFAAS